MMRVMKRGSGMTVMKQMKLKKICICIIMMTETMTKTLMMMRMQRIDCLFILIYLSTLHVKQFVVTLLILYE